MFILVGDTNKQFDSLLNFSEDFFLAATGSHSSTSIAFLKRQANVQNSYTKTMH